MFGYLHGYLSAYMKLEYLNVDVLTIKVIVSDQLNNSNQYDNMILIWLK